MPSSWKRYGETETLKMQELAGLIQLTDNSVYKDYLRLSIKDVDDNIEGHKYLLIQSKTYRIINYTKNHYDRTLDVELEEVITTDPAYTKKIIPLSSIDGASTQGSAQSVSASDPSSLINDGLTTAVNTWSSNKINSELSGKEDSISANTYEPYDLAIVKSDESETIQQNWTWGSNTITAGNFIDASDFYLKKNIKQFNTDAFMKIRPRQYQLREGGQRPILGVIAQDLIKVMPDSVYIGSDGMLGVSYKDLFMLTLSKVQEHERLLERLNRRSFWQWLKFKVIG